MTGGFSGRRAVQGHLVIGGMGEAETGQAELVAHIGKLRTVSDGQQGGAKTFNDGVGRGGAGDQGGDGGGVGGFEGADAGH